jgi:hypothetical protein
VAAEHRPFLALLRKHYADRLPSEVDAVRQMLDSAGWALVSDLIEIAHGEAVSRLLFEHTGAEGRVLDQAEYARLLGFLAGLRQSRVAAEAFLIHAARVKEG